MQNAWGGKGNKSLKNFVKHVAANTVWQAGLLENYVKARSRNTALILGYHRVNKKEYMLNNKSMPGMYLSDEAFESHIKWLLNNYQIITVRDIIGRIKSHNRWREPVCAITFDDGWYDNYEHAFPIVKRYEVPISIFVIGKQIGTCEPDFWHLWFEIIQRMATLPSKLTGIREIDHIISLQMDDRIEKARLVINRCRRLGKREIDRVWEILGNYTYEMFEPAIINQGYRMLSWENMREMQQYRVEFGYHSKTHYMLTGVPKEDLCAEIMSTREEAENYGVIMQDIFCYPDGQYNDYIVKRLQQMGYEGAMSSVKGLNRADSDPYALRRVSMHEEGTGTVPALLFGIAFS